VASSSALAETVRTNDATTQETMIEVIINSEAANQAFIGFMYLNIINQQIEFGPWNRHKCKPAEVSKLLDSFHRNHVWCFEPMHAMPILVKRS
jgi:hypothetical protein